MNNYQKLKSAGFSLIEVVITSAIISGVLITIITSILTLNRHQDEIILKSKAGWLLMEGAEAMRLIRDSHWALPLGDNYGLTWQENNWALISEPEVVLDNFIRTIRIEEVYRDGSGTIAPSGEIAENSRKITVSVTYPAGETESQSQEISFYLINLFGENN